MILSTSAEAIARYLEHASDAGAGAVPSIPGCRLLKCPDLWLHRSGSYQQLASRHRDRLVQSLATRQGRPIADVEGDLTQVQALARLIDAIFITTRIEPEATAVERSIGVIFHEPGKEPARQP